MAVNYVGNADLLYILNKIKAVLDAGFIKIDDKVTNEILRTALTKLDGIAEGAEVNVQSDWAQTDPAADDFIKNKPVIDTVMSDSSTNAVENKTIKAYVDSLISQVTSIEFKKVTKLPTTGENGVIYLVPKTKSEVNNVYEEYIWISADSKFEKIGETDIDLSGYVKTTDLVEITTADIDTMFATVFGA